MKKLYTYYPIVTIFVNIFLYTVSFQCDDDDYSNSKKIILTTEEYMPGVICHVNFCQNKLIETKKLLEEWTGNVEQKTYNVLITLPHKDNINNNKIPTINFILPTTIDDDGHNLRQKIVNKLMRLNLILYYIKQCKQNFLNLIKEENKKQFETYYNKIIYKIFEQNGEMHEILKNEFSDKKDVKINQYPTMIKAENIVRNAINNDKKLIQLFEALIINNKDSNNKDSNNKDINEQINDILTQENGNLNNDNILNNENNKNNLDKQYTKYDILTGIIDKQYQEELNLEI